MLNFRSQVLQALLIFSMLVILSSFTFALCGNGIIDLGEQCDGTNINQMTCEKLDQGFTTGMIVCNSDCTINTADCGGANNIVDLNTPNGQANQNNNSGNLGAGGSPGSGPNSFCGDGKVNGKEECDGGDLNGQTCERLGYLSGELSCTQACIFDLRQCSGIQARPNSNLNQTAQGGQNGGLMDPKEFPVSNLFEAGSLRNTFVPEILAVVCGIWSMLMSFAALNIRKKREENENKEILSSIKNKP